MKQLTAAAFTLAAIVAGLVLATSLSSPAQEEGTEEGTATTTTVARSDHPFGMGFGFRFSDEMPPALDELMGCLADEGIDIPEQPDGSLMFDLGPEDIEGLADALEACGLAGVHEGFPFGGELPEDLFDDFPDGFEFGDGFGFHHPPFGGELPDGFEDGFEFHPFGIDRDALAACLAELGSFDGVDEVRAKLDECLPDPLGRLRPNEPGGMPGLRGYGFPFGGNGHHGFEFGDPAPDPDQTST